jgi:arsenite/tail-anchored protein-transporting ATPase
VRVLLFTGKGGVGKTTTAAATASLIAAQGVKTLVLSTDPAHSLSDSLQVPPGAEPSECSPGLFVQQIDVDAALTRSWQEIQGYLRTLLETSGIDQLRAEELTALPGAEEILALLELRSQVRSGQWDCVVVDCAPTADTLRLLALPEALDWYLTRLYPIERRVVRALRPVLGATLGTALPQESVLEAADRLRGELLDVQELLQSPMTSVRLVLTPESVVVAEARRTFTALTLFGYTVDSVVVNRVFPPGGDAWRAGWVAAQSDQLREVRDSFSPLPVRLGTYQDREPLGVGALVAFGASLYDGADPMAAPPDRELMVVRRKGNGFELSVALPLVDRGDLDLARVADDLVITAAGRRRVLALPSALRRCTVEAAALVDGTLNVTFAPDRAQWPDEMGPHP